MAFSYLDARELHVLVDSQRVAVARADGGGEYAAVLAVGGPIDLQAVDPRQEQARRVAWSDRDVIDHPSAHLIHAYVSLLESGREVLLAAATIALQIDCAGRYVPPSVV